MVDERITIQEERVQGLEKMLKEIHLVIQRYKNKNIEKVVTDKIESLEDGMREWKERTQKLVLDNESKIKKINISYEQRMSKIENEMRMTFDNIENKPQYNFQESNKKPLTSSQNS